MATFGDRLKILLKERGITQKQLAKYLGTSHSLISEYISNKKEPGIYKAKLIADFLSVDLYWLITGKHQVPGKAPRVSIQAGQNSVIQNINDVRGEYVVIGGVEIPRRRTTDKIEGLPELIQNLTELTPEEREQVANLVKLLLRSRDKNHGKE